MRRNYAPRKRAGSKRLVQGSFFQRPWAARRRGSEYPSLFYSRYRSNRSCLARQVPVQGLGQKAHAAAPAPLEGRPGDPVGPEDVREPRVGTPGEHERPKVQRVALLGVHEEELGI